MRLWPIITAMIAVPVILGSMSPGETQLRPELVQQASAEREVRTILRDPASATFRHLAPGRCGYVNARNGLGGMSGYQRFIVTASGPELELASDARSFAQAWRALCT